MLKTELKQKLEEERAKSSDYANDRIRVMRENKEKDEEIRALKRDLRDVRRQMEQISQSIYTVLQIKYPYNQYQDHGTVDQTPDNEEKRFLLFIHDLCADRVNQNISIDLNRFN